MVEDAPATWWQRLDFRPATRRELHGLRREYLGLLDEFEQVLYQIQKLYNRETQRDRRAKGAEQPDAATEGTSPLGSADPVKALKHAFFMGKVSGMKPGRGPVAVRGGHRMPRDPSTENGSTEK